jgi:hypothetical protein
VTAAPTTVRVTWPDGTTIEAGSWAWLLRRVHRLPWNRNLPGARAMRNELSRRTYVLTGELVSPALPAADFWHGLEHAGAIRLYVER